MGYEGGTNTTASKKRGDLAEMKLRKATILFLLAFLVLAQYGCAVLAGAAAGGTGAYIMRDQGYKVQSPIKKDKPD